MNYGQFTGTSGPYTGVQPVVADKTYVSPTQGPYTGVDPGQGYATVKPVVAAPDNSPPYFAYMSAITDGVGDYHFNHFIACFDVVQKDEAPSTSLFYDKFCDVFSKANIAEVVKSDKTFNDLPAYKFTIGGNLGSNLHKITGSMHDDWVAMQMFKDQKSFYGSTLRRIVNTAGEDAMLDAASTTAALSNRDEDYQQYALLMSINEVIKKHFLAGRRSWCVGYDSDLKHFCVETAALERSSDVLYFLLEKSPMNLRQDVIDLWTNLIVNFMAVFGVTLRPIDQLEPSAQFVLKDYSVQNNVAYRTGDNKDIFAASQTPWFARALKKHLGLIENLVPDQK